MHAVAHSKNRTRSEPTTSYVHTTSPVSAATSIMVRDKPRVPAPDDNVNAREKVANGVERRAARRR